MTLKRAKRACKVDFFEMLPSKPSILREEHGKRKLVLPVMKKRIFRRGINILQKNEVFLWKNIYRTIN